MKLRKFNATSESKKLNNRKRKEYNVKVRTMVLSIGILVCSIILCTYAAFKTSGKVDVIKSSVGNLVQDDYTINVFIEGVASNTVPDEDDGYIVDSITCTNGATGTWDDTNWGILITNATEPTECSVYFEELPKPAVPELYNGTADYGGLIPIKYTSTGDAIVADPENGDNDWYDYDNHEWANAVIVSNYTDYFDENGDFVQSKVGETIISSNIMQYYVWIPRFRYLLFNAEKQVLDEQMIEVEFEDCNAVNGNCTNNNYEKQTGSTNGEWLTHPAFTFGDNEINGFWVGKFESTHTSMTSTTGSDCIGIATNCSTETCSHSDNVRILPNKNTLRNNSISQLYYLARSITKSENIFGLNIDSVDSHMIKNMEWGAVAYLTNSIYGLYQDENTCYNSAQTYTNGTAKGCQIWNNNYLKNVVSQKINHYSFKTGCSGTEMNSSSNSSSPVCYPWNDSTYGGNSSTTGNLYGIYDMSGGAFDFVMANMQKSNGNFYVGQSGFESAPPSKYCDYYPYSSNKSFMGKLGDATSETYGWYQDNVSYFDPSISYKTYVFLGRGSSSYINSPTTRGVFAFTSLTGDRDNGNGNGWYTFYSLRVVLSSS